MHVSIWTQLSWQTCASSSCLFVFVECLGKSKENQLIRLLHIYGILGIDKRNGIAFAALGDKPYQAPEYSTGFHALGSTLPLANFRWFLCNVLNASCAFNDYFLQWRHQEEGGHVRASRRASAHPKVCFSLLINLRNIFTCVLLSNASMESMN